MNSSLKAVGRHPQRFNRQSVVLGKFDILNEDIFFYLRYLLYTLLERTIDNWIGCGTWENVFEIECLSDKLNE